MRLGCLRDFVDCLCCTGNSSHISHGQLSVSNNTRCRTHAGLSGPPRRCGRQKGSGALSAAEVAADLVGQLGVLQLRTGKLRPADPADLITHQAPVDYDPDAKCPLWLLTLEDSIHNGYGKKCASNNGWDYGWESRSIGIRRSPSGA